MERTFHALGDPTSIGDYPNATDNYDLVPSGLIKLIKQGFNTGVDHAGINIGQPTSFYVGAAINLNPPDLSRECKTLHRKIRAGADFLLSQPLYDSKLLQSFLEHYQSEFGPLKIPIMVGVLPLANARHAAYLSQEVPGISIPPSIQKRLEKAGENGAHTGIKIAVELIQQFMETAQGIYIMPAFNRFDYAAEIIESTRSMLS